MADTKEKKKHSKLWSRLRYNPIPGAVIFLVAALALFQQQKLAYTIIYSAVVIGFVVFAGATVLWFLRGKPKKPVKK